MRRTFFFIVAVCLATSSFALIPRASALDVSSPRFDPLPETRIRVSEDLAPFERRAPSLLSRALRQAYEQASTTNASGLAGFLSVDPSMDQKANLPSPQRWNRYSYVSNNPINKIDPDGRDEWAMAQRQLGFEDDWHGRDKYQAAGLAAAGVVAGGIAAAPALAGGGVAPGAFSLAPIARGWAIEAALAAKFGGGLPRNFPTIDRFLNGVATSVKSMDLMSKTYQNTARLTSTLTGYIDKLAQFNGARLAGAQVPGGAITQRVLEVAIQAGVATPAQKAALQRAAAYAKEHNVVLKVITIR